MSKKNSKSSMSLISNVKRITRRKFSSEEVSTRTSIIRVIVLLWWSVLCPCVSHSQTETTNKGNFSIIPHADPGFTATNRKIEVFGIPVYAFKEVEDEKLIHAATIMAEYLDNDEDGMIDNLRLHRELIKNDAALFLWKKPRQIRLNAQDLGAHETRPEWHQNGRKGQFDATLEEVFHVFTQLGYAKAYPEIFGENQGTELSKALDKARGGYHEKVPRAYTEDAWFTYYDRTCKYDCMCAEYIYWAMTSILGAQENRLPEIGDEWRLNTKELVEQRDSMIYSLLTNPKYHFPTRLPDGNYHVKIH